MAEETNQIKGHIDSTRKELAENLHELEHRVKKATEWQTYVDKSPATMITLAFAGGILASALIGGRSRARRSSFTGHPLREISDAERGSGTSYQNERGGNSTWEAIKETVVGLATAEMKNVMDDVIPGFRQHYERFEARKADLPRSRPNLTM